MCLSARTYVLSMFIFHLAQHEIEIDIVVTSVVRNPIPSDGLEPPLHHPPFCMIGLLRLVGPAEADFDQLSGAGILDALDHPCAFLETLLERPSSFRA